MKTSTRTVSLCLSLAALSAGSLSAQSAAPATPAPASAPALASPSPSPLASSPSPVPAALQPQPSTSTPPQEASLRFNFRGAPLEQVLNYLSEAAGYTIVLETSIRGTVDMWSAQPVSKAEAVQLLNLAINRQGYTAALNGRTLVVSSKEDAKKRSIPIRTGNDPQEIPANADMVIQIVPLRNLTAANAARDLATLLPGSSNILANEDSNSLVITDTQLNVRHIVEIVAQLDGSGDAISSMKVYHLRNADPTELATTLNNLFSGGSSSNSNRNQQQTQANPFMGGPGAMFANMMGNRGGNNQGNRSGTSSSSSTRTKQGSFYAVADQRTRSVVITASKDAFGQIAEIIAQLDSGTARNQKVYVYSLQNANVKQVETMLKNLFQSNTTRSTTSSTQTDPLVTRQSNNTQTTTSSTMSSSSSSSSSR